MLVNAGLSFTLSENFKARFDLGAEVFRSDYQSVNFALTLQGKF